MDLRGGIDREQEDLIEQLQHVAHVDRDAADDQARGEPDDPLKTFAVPRPAASVRAVLPVGDLVVRVDGVVPEVREFGGQRRLAGAWVAGGYAFPVGQYLSTNAPTESAGGLRWRLHCRMPNLGVSQVVIDPDTGCLLQTVLNWPWTWSAPV